MYCAPAWTVAFVVLVATLAAGETPRYHTVYACEGNDLSIKCEAGQQIKLIRANYGRFSITICNRDGNTEWSVNCMAPRSLRVLHRRCGSGSSCTVPVTNEVFGNPCPGTSKYLEVHYNCSIASPPSRNDNYNNRRQPPPWAQTTKPGAWIPTPSTTTSTTTTTTTTTTHPPHRTTTTTTTPSTTTTTTTPATTTTSTSTTTSSTPPPIRVPPPKVDVEEDGRNDVDVVTDAPSPSLVTKRPEKTITTYKPPPYPPVPPSPSTLPQDSSKSLVQYCPPTAARSLYWNWTRAGNSAVQPCPGGATGYATWKCDGDLIDWVPSQPDLSQCKTVWLNSLETRVDGDDAMIMIAHDLSTVTNSNKSLYGGDMVATTKIMKKLAVKMSADIQAYPDQRQSESIITELLENVIQTGSNLLDRPQQVAWKDLSREEQLQAATALLVGLEENAFLLADVINREKTVIQAFKNILMTVKVLETRNIYDVTFPSRSELEQWNHTLDTITLSSRSLLENSDGFVRIVFFTYNNMEEILKPDSEEDMSYVEGSSPRTTTHSRVLNSKVISASLGKGRHIQLQEPVRISLQHLQVENVSNPMCVFWDYTTSYWSEEGCRRVAFNATHTTCECNHLTNFAVLMDVHGTVLMEGHEMALTVITYVGCIISIICLVFAVFTFHFFKGLKSDRTTIHKNLCMCLLIAEVVFIAGVQQTGQRVVCGIVAGLLHFFFLCAFGWMLLEGFQLYVMLIEVFESEKSRIRWYYALGYGIPALIVAISCVVDPFSYGTDRYCWLRADNYFILSFVGPVVAVILANLVFLSLAIYTVCRHSNPTATLKSKEQTRLANIKTWLRGAVVLVFLLGLTWTFGLLYLNENSVVMAYIFTILNSLQGLFIFVFHCVQNEKVKKEYRKFVRRNSWLPECLRMAAASGGKEHSNLFVGSSASNTHNVTANTGVSPQNSSYFQRMWSGRSSHGKSTSTTDSSTGGSVAARSSHRGRASTLQPPNQEAENYSFKSYSRDSGHGGSEQEDSPRSHTTALHSLNNSRNLNNNFNAKEPSAPPLNHAVTNNLTLESCANIEPRFIPTYTPAGGLHVANGSLQNPHIKMLQQQKRTGFGRSISPFNHTYMEIDIRDGRPIEEDPVYEEIERERSEMQVSDMSDEDLKRQSDISRQSSRSYNDNRPLIPFNFHHDRNLINTISSAFHSPQSRNKPYRQNHSHYPSLHDLSGHSVDILHSTPEYKTYSLSRGALPRQYLFPDAPYQHHHSMALHYHGNPMDLGNHVQEVEVGPFPVDNSTVAVLNGDRVVCHLQNGQQVLPNSSELHSPHSPRNLRIPSFSEC